MCVVLPCAPAESDFDFFAFPLGVASTALRFLSDGVVEVAVAVGAEEAGAIGRGGATAALVRNRSSRPLSMTLALPLAEKSSDERLMVDFSAAAEIP